MSRNARPARRMQLYPASAVADMEAFDALPAPIRARLASAVTNIAAIPLRDFWISDVGDCVQRFTALQSALDDAQVGVVA